MWYTNKRNEYQAFYDEIRALASFSRRDNSFLLSKEKIKHTLTDILVFLSEQVDLKSPITEGVYSLQYLSAQPLLHHRSGPFFRGKNSLNQAASQAIALSLQIFSYMFGADHVNICEQTVISDYDYEVIPLSPARLRYPMLQHDSEGMISALYEDHIATEIAKLNGDLNIYILDLDCILSGLFSTPSDEHIPKHLKTNYRGLDVELYKFSEKLRARNTLLQFDDIRVLFTEILGPFFATFVPPEGPLAKRLIEKYRDFSRQCMQHGQFAEFGIYALKFCELANSHKAHFERFFAM